MTKQYSPILLSTSFLVGSPQHMASWKLNCVRLKLTWNCHQNCQNFKLHETIISPYGGPWHAHFTSTMPEQHFSPSHCISSWVWKCILGQPWTTHFILLTLAKQLFWLSRDVCVSGTAQQVQSWYSCAPLLYHFTAPQPKKSKAKQGQRGTTISRL